MTNVIIRYECTVQNIKARKYDVKYTDDDDRISTRWHPRQSNHVQRIDITVHAQSCGLHAMFYYTRRRRGPTKRRRRRVESCLMEVSLFERNPSIPTVYFVVVYLPWTS